MKRSILILSALFAVVLTASTAFAATISASKHDFSATGTGAKGDYNEICVYCHTPHNGASTVPLWNKSLPAVGGFTLYPSGGSMVGTPALNPVSQACLACHDGVGTISSVTNSPSGNAQTAANGGGVTGDKITSGNALVGTNLANDHPIGMGLPIASDFKLAAALTGGAVLYSSKVECASCHNPHDPANAPFLRGSNAASALCLGCHDT